jgi:ABC-type sugar transport system ATPase subunit
MIYVTHDQVEAMTLGQRIVVLKDGIIQQIDTPMALYDRPANLFVAGFLGSPAMNVLRGTLQGDAGGVTVVDGEWRTAGPGHHRSGLAAEADRGGRASGAPAAGGRRRCACVRRTH